MNEDKKKILKMLSEQKITVDEAEKLLTALEKNSFMSNIFGRNIVPSSDRESIIFNNWVQSSAVDVSLIGFQNLVEKLRFEKLDFEPLFLIHDALIIDASPDMVKRIEKDSSMSIFIKELGHFPISVEYLS